MKSFAKRSSGLGAMGRRASGRGLRPGLEALEGRQLMASSAAFDFGPAGSPVMAGYVGAGAGAYDPAKGYGWQDSTGLVERDRATANALTRDLVFGSNGTFQVALQDWSYDVTVTMGDASFAHDQVAISAQGQVVATGLSTAIGQFTQAKFRVGVIGGKLSLNLADRGGADPNFAIDALQVVPTATPQFTAMASGPATAPAGSTVTLQGSAGFGKAPYTYAWDLDGSGRYATAGQAVADLIADARAYPASLRVTDSAGAVATSTTSVLGTPIPAVAHLDRSSYQLTAGHGVMFQGSATSVAPTSAAAGLTYTWDFGDGSPIVSGRSLATTSHIYPDAGSFTARLTVRDVFGLVSAPAVAAVTASPSDMIDTGMELIPDFGAHPTIRSVASGDWSNPATWSGRRLPGSGDVVDIVAGTDVSYNVNDLVTAYKAVEIQDGGALRFRTDINTGLLVGNFEVLEGGILEIGTPSRPVASNVTASVLIADQAIDTASDPQQYGTGLIGLGKVTISGATKTPTFDRLAVEPRAGVTTLKVSEPVRGWMPGDTLILPDTRQLQGVSSNYATQDEQVRLLGVSPDGTVLTIGSPLRFNHLGATDDNGNLVALPHVNNITRNVTIRSQNPQGVRGHVLLTDRADVDVRFAGFNDLGRTTNDPINSTTFDSLKDVVRIGTNQIGRYPLHIHHLMGPMTSPADGYQFTLIGDEIGNDPASTPRKWGIAIHGSSYGLIRDNVVFHVAGAGLVTEDGSESYNLISHNSVVQVSGTGSQSADAREGAGFWFRGPNNIVRDNVAAEIGSASLYSPAFTYYSRYLGSVSVPAFPGADPDDPTQSVVVDMNATPVREFSGNEAYGATSEGLTLWWIGNFGGMTRDVGTSSITRFLAWNVHSYGIYNYMTKNVVIDGFRMYDNPENLRLGLWGAAGFFSSDYLAENLVIENSDIQGTYTGITLPLSTGGVTVTVRDTHLHSSIDVYAATLWSVSYRSDGLAPRKTVLKDVLFDVRPLYQGSQPLAIKTSFGAGGGTNVIQHDEMDVINYNRVAGDDFRVYYEAQAADYVIPVTVLNPDGTPNILGSPEAGLTNLQAWNKYGVAIGGAVAPSTAKRRSGIVGLVAPL